MGIAAVLGGELAWVADNDPGAALILAHRYPNVPNLGDITTADWSRVPPVDVLCAGFPCTDVSAAGRRAGLKHGTRSGVWHSVARAIGELRPGLVLIENVRGLLTARGDEPTDEHLAAEGTRDACTRLLAWLDNEMIIAAGKGDTRRVRRIATRAYRVMGTRKRAVDRCHWHERRLVRAIGTVLGSLASVGYDAQWTVVRASDTGAPHRRERVFILAWPAADPGCDTRPEDDQDKPVAASGGGETAADTGGQRLRQLPGAAPGEETGPAGGDVAGGRRGERADRDGWPAADSASSRQCGTENTGAGRGGESRRAWCAELERDGGEPAENSDGATGGERRVAAPVQTPGGRSWSDAGGPGRARVAPVAANTTGDGRDERRPEPAWLVRGPDAAVGGDGLAADTEGSTGCVGNGDDVRPGRGVDGRGQAAGGGAAADTGHHGRERCPQLDGATTTGVDCVTGGHADGCGDDPGRGTAACHRVAAADTDSGLGGRRPGEPQRETEGRETARRDSPATINWGPYERAIRRWEQRLGVPAPPPTEPGKTGMRLSPAFVEWLMGLPPGWVTDVPGLSRNAQLKALGNGCVPQQVALALELLLPGISLRESA